MARRCHEVEAEIRMMQPGGSERWFSTYILLSCCMYRIVAHFLRGGRRQVLPFQTFQTTGTSSQDTVHRERLTICQCSARESREQVVWRNQGADGQGGGVSQDQALSLFPRRSFLSEKPTVIDITLIGTKDFFALEMELNVKEKGKQRQKK